MVVFAGAAMDVRAGCGRLTGIVVLAFRLCVVFSVCTVRDASRLLYFSSLLVRSVIVARASTNALSVVCRARRWSASRTF